MAVPLSGTFTVRVIPPLTVQLESTPAIVTVWLSAVRSVKVTLPLTGIDCVCGFELETSIWTKKSSDGMFVPVVELALTREYVPMLLTLLQHEDSWVREAGMEAMELLQAS